MIIDFYVERRKQILLIDIFWINARFGSEAGQKWNELPSKTGE